MINDTDAVIVKTGNPFDSIAQSISIVNSFFAEKYGDTADKNSKRWVYNWREFASGLAGLNGQPSLINDIVDMAASKGDFDALANNMLAEHLDLSGEKRREIAVGCAKYVTYVLWANDAILLPLKFNFGRSILHKDRVSLGSELTKYLLQFSPSETDTFKFGSGLSDRVVKKSQPWITSTDWHRFEDIKLDDVVALYQHVESFCSEIGLSIHPTFRSSVVPLLLKNMPERLSFSAEDWAMVDEELDAKNDAKRARNSVSSLTSNGIEIYSSSPRIGWFCFPEEVKGTGYEFSKEDAEKWSGLLDNYGVYREKIQGFEAIDIFKKNFAVFADYVSVFLPRCRMAAGETKGRISAPKDFTRYPFIDQRGEKLPFPTLLDYYRERSNTPDTIRSWLGAARDFFIWVGANYRDKENKDIVGPEFRIPIETKLDMPRSKKRNTTNKKPFGVMVVPHLLKWLYAIEEFGMHLQSAGHDLSKYSRYDEVECRYFGFVPTYEFMGESYEVPLAPVALLKSLGPKAGVSLTALRMFIFTFETGLRVQSSQWLDRRTWDDYNQKVYPDQDVFTLHVNTDKTHGSWQTQILGRTRNLLLREQTYQECLGIEWYDEPYEGRSNSRFDDVQPLFRDFTATTTQTISDKKYASLWKHILFPFQRYALHADLNLPLLCRYEKPQNLKIVNDRDGVERVDLYEKVFHTPHSCRSTFVTRRSSLIGLDAVADLVGHSNPIVTSHYNYTELDELSKKLEYADNTVMTAKDGAPQVSSGPAFVKAQEVNSALRKSFNADRDETISRYKMITLSSIHADEKEDKNGIDLLRGSRASEIIFRDTHICPVGELCPNEVVDEIGESRRCGLCQYACKSLDHLPAIAAKRKSLIGLILHNKLLYDAAQKDENRQAELEEIYERIHLDTQEYFGWSSVEKILSNILQDNSDADYIHTDEPEIVRKHLKRVVKSSNVQEFVLERIVEAGEYPSLRTDELRLKANRFMRRVMASDAPEFSPFEDRDPDAELEAVASAITARMRAEGLSISQISEQITNQLGAPSSPTLVTENQGGE